jgi:REP element-mobilizing transposase RayT
VVGRAPRPLIENGTYHANSVGAGGIDIVRDAVDRERLLRVVAYVVLKRGWLLHAYCVMSNHYHLVFTTPEGDIDRGMHVINGFYAQTFNKRHARKGHLFGARYDARPIETLGHALNVAAYVPLNPCRAGLCELPEQWPWSSFAATVGLRRRPPYLDDAWLLDLFDDRDPDNARFLYRTFVTSIALAESAGWAMPALPQRAMKVPGTFMASPTAAR